MNDRQKEILELLKKKKYLSVKQLVNTFVYSESTIRRDLVELSKVNLIQRTPGGALFLKEEYIENPQVFKYDLNTDKKKYIASLAIDFIENYHTIFLDSSTTNFYFSEELKRRNNLSVLTTNLKTALNIDKNLSNTVYCAGGKLSDEKVGGPETEKFIQKFHADICFISCRGFDLSFGISDMLETEASIKQSFKKNSEKVILMIDSTKFDKKFWFKIFDISVIDIVITDRRPSTPVVEFLEKADIDLVY